MSDLTSRGWAAEIRSARDRGAWIPSVTDILHALWTLLVTIVALSAGLAAVGVRATDELRLVLMAFVASFVLDVALARPLRALASRGSVLLALVLGLAAQLLVLGAALSIADDADLGAGETLVVVLVAATVLAAGRWLSGATDSRYVVGAATSRTRRTRSNSSGRGMLVIQLDGLALPVLERAIAGGQAPNIARWIGTSHTLTPWWATIPCTTPASMAGFLHGSGDIPAFRWCDRRAQRLLVASNPADSRLVESRFPPDSGLLRGGTAVSTTYSGDAERAYLAISRSTRLRDLGSGSTYLSFFLRPFLLPGALVLTVGEVIKEIYQGYRQRVRDVRPRVPRKLDYAMLRGLTNVLLRKLDLSLIAEEMAQGSPIIFADFVDYDEIAHHAGPERPEAMRAIEGLDDALAALEEVARSVATHYDLVVLSDHGQSLGSTFLQLNGCSLADRVAELMSPEGREAALMTTSQGGEERGPLNALLASVTGGGDRPAERVVSDSWDPEVVVTGGGNLGMVWFARMTTRPHLGEIDTAWPALLPGLLSSDGVGLVMVADDAGAPLVIGPTGVRGLGASDVRSGDDPLRGYPARTADDLSRLHGLRDCGDLVLISTVDEFGRIHAFEEQVGSHGGIGGPQNHAILLHPSDWKIDDTLTEVVPELGPAPVIVGAWNVHRQLLMWREGP